MSNSITEPPKGRNRLTADEVRKAKIEKARATLNEFMSEKRGLSVSADTHAEISDEKFNGILATLDDAAAADRPADEPACQKDSGGNEVLSDSLANATAPAALPSNGVLSDSLAKPKPRKNRVREAETLAGLRLAARPHDPPPSDASIMGYDTPNLPPTSATPDDATLFRKRHTVPPLWRDLSALRKATLWHDIVLDGGHGYGFTVYASKEIDAKLKQIAKRAMEDQRERGPLRWLQQKLDYELKKAMGIAPSWWAALEEGPNMGRYHLHGGIIIPGDTGPVLDVFRGITERNKADVQLNPNTDKGWTSYAAKTIKLNHNGLVTASMPLKSATMAAYSDWRQGKGRDWRGTRWDWIE